METLLEAAEFNYEIDSEIRNLNESIDSYYRIKELVKVGFEPEESMNESISSIKNGIGNIIKKIKDRHDKTKKYNSDKKERLNQANELLSRIKKEKMDTDIEANIHEQTNAPMVIKLPATNLMDHCKSLTEVKKTMKEMDTKISELDDDSKKEFNEIFGGKKTKEYLETYYGKVLSSFIPRYDGKPTTKENLTKVMNDYFLGEKKNMKIKFDVISKNLKAIPNILKFIEDKHIDGFVERIKKELDEIDTIITNDETLKYAPKYVKNIKDSYQATFDAVAQLYDIIITISDESIQVLKDIISKHETLQETGLILDSTLLVESEENLEPEVELINENILNEGMFGNLFSKNKSKLAYVLSFKDYNNIYEDKYGGIAASFTIQNEICSMLNIYFGAEIWKISRLKEKKILINKNFMQKLKTTEIHLYTINIDKVKFSNSHSSHDIELNAKFVKILDKESMTLMDFCNKYEVNVEFINIDNQIRTLKTESTKLLNDLAKLLMSKYNDIDGIYPVIPSTLKDNFDELEMGSKYVNIGVWYLWDYNKNARTDTDKNDEFYKILADIVSELNLKCGKSVYVEVDGDWDDGFISVVYGSQNESVEFNIIDKYKSLNEAADSDKLSKAERDTLKDSDFGVPSKRQYPIHDETRLRKAIQFFHYCKAENKQELANNIAKKVKKLELVGKVNVSSKNPNKKYFPDWMIKEDDKKSQNECSLIVDGEEVDIMN